MAEIAFPSAVPRATFSDADIEYHVRIIANQYIPGALFVMNVLLALILWRVW